MVYNRVNWETGDVMTKEKMNRSEEQLAILTADDEIFREALLTYRTYTTDDHGSATLTWSNNDIKTSNGASLSDDTNTHISTNWSDGAVPKFIKVANGYKVKIGLRSDSDSSSFQGILQADGTLKTSDTDIDSNIDYYHIGIVSLAHLAITNTWDVRFVLMNIQDNTTITPAEGTNLLVCEAIDFQEMIAALAETVPAVDNTLATAGAAADAKATGDAVAAAEAALAPTFSTSTAYTAGQYVWYDGNLYKFTTDHAAGSWNAAQVELADVANDLAGDITQLKSALDENLIDKISEAEPVNWFDPTEETTGILYANGTTEASNSRCYSGYIPVKEEDVIRQYYGNSAMPAIYRRNICAYDASKNVLSAKGTDSASNGSWTVPSGVSFIRMTFDKTYDDKAMITKNTVPTEYSAYFEPYKEYNEDFLTPESEEAIQKVKDKTLSTLDLRNNFACAFPKTPFRQTVGLPETWYYKNGVHPDYPSYVSIGSAYQELLNGGTHFTNDTALSSVNGYVYDVYDVLGYNIVRFREPNAYGQERKIIAENLSNCSLLVIGDSTVDQDVMTQKMLDYFTSKSKTLTLLGTLGSGDNKNEGRAGWKATDYLTDKKYDGVTNPFYNSSTETFDFSYYMTNQGYSAPDFIVIQLGTNDIYNGSNTAQATWAALKTMVDSIRTYNSSIKIILNLPAAINSDASKHYVSVYFNHMLFVKYNEYALAEAKKAYSENNVRCSYCHLILDPTTDIQDNVHPTATGYEKMAKEIINQINCWQNGV